MDTRARSLSFFTHNNITSITNTREFSEFYGIMIGGETLYHSRNCRYFFSIVEGAPEYGSYIVDLVRTLIGREPRLKFRSKAYRIEFKSKRLFNVFTYLGFPVGRKSTIISISSEILQSKYINWVIRGIFDTDGTVFLSRKPGIEEYPTIEITSKSLILLNQVKHILEKQYNIDSRIRKSDKAYKLVIYGRNQIVKWVKFINSSHKRKSWLLARVIRRS